MKLVLEIAGEEGAGARHHVVSAFPVTVGRAYASDVILTDPHAGERQFTLDEDGGGWTLTDHGGVNPTLLNGRPLRGGAARLASGDTLRAGLTVVRVFSPDHPLPVAVKVQKTPPLFLHLTRPLNVWIYFFLAVSSAVGATYATVWSEDVSMTLLGSAAGSSAVLVIWAALWAVAGRLLRHRTFFSAHLSLIGLYFVCGAAAAALCALLNFLSSDNVLSLVLEYAVNAALLALLVYGSLSLSTLMKKRKRVAAALFLACGVTLGILGVGIAQKQKFSPDPPYSTRLLPFAGRFAPAHTVGAFIGDSANIFDSGVLDREDKKGDAP